MNCDLQAPTAELQEKHKRTQGKCIEYPIHVFHLHEGLTNQGAKEDAPQNQGRGPHVSVQEEDKPGEGHLGRPNLV